MWDSIRSFTEVMTSSIYCFPLLYRAGNFVVEGYTDLTVSPLWIDRGYPQSLFFFFNPQCVLEMVSGKMYPLIFPVLNVVSTSLSLPRSSSWPSFEGCSDICFLPVLGNIPYLPWLDKGSWDWSTASAISKNKTSKLCCQTSFVMVWDFESDICLNVLLGILFH